MISGIETTKPIIGMVHLEALPGAPGFDGNRQAIREAMRRDARRLANGGVDALMIENFGDSPFYAADVPKHTVATMATLVADIGRTVELPLGVNVLRNDAEAAVSIAAATGASFVRVNVHTGTRVTDQGVVTGQAAETLRLRDRLSAEVDILADVDVKHSAPVTERPLSEEVVDLIERGHADGIIVTGAGTGRETDRKQLNAIIEAQNRMRTDIPVLVGSGVTRDTAAETLELADGIIVGSDLKQDGNTAAPVDEQRVRDLVAAT